MEEQRTNLSSLKLPDRCISGIYTDTAKCHFTRMSDTFLYLWSVMADNAGSVFETFPGNIANRIVFIDKRYRTSLGKDCEVPYKKSLTLSDLFLLSVYVNSVLSFPMFYSFFGMDEMYSYSTLRNTVISTLKREGYINISAAKNDLPSMGAGTMYYYTISQSGLSYLRVKYPELHLPSSHVVIRRGSGKILHDYYAKLSAMQLFAHISGSCPNARELSAGIYYEELVPSYVRYSLSSSPNASGDLRADALIRYHGGQVFIEQDMLTESGQIVLDKFKSYCERCGYGPTQINTAGSLVIFCTHSPNVPAGEGGDFARKISMSNPDFFSSRYLKELAAAASGINTINVLAGEGGDFDRFKELAEALYKPTRYKKTDAGSLDMDILMELVGYYYYVTGYEDVSDVLLCHGLEYGEREGEMGEKYGCVPYYHAAFSSKVQSPSCDARLELIRTFCLEAARKLDYSLPADDVINAICSGFSFLVMPTLQMGRYIELADAYSAESALRPVVSTVDAVLYNRTVFRSYESVMPGSNLPGEKNKLFEITASHSFLRLRNVFSSFDVSPVCVEFSWDACSAARIMLHMKAAAISRKRGRSTSALPRIVLICRDEDEIASMHSLMNNRNIEDLSGVQDPLLLFYALIDDVLSGSPAIYACGEGGITLLSA